MPFWWIAIIAPLTLEPTSLGLATDYQQNLLPILQQHCWNCHSAEKREGELDLEQFTSVAEIRTQPQVWQHVAEMLASGEMPPKDALVLPPAAREQLQAWIRGFLAAEALAQAGDPGPVVLRRLSNAQYTYTIHDLTGVPIDPAREFPADSAAGEGFTNTGSALVMSPALFTKYLDAAKRIAAHAELLPHGFRFSPSDSRDDWTQQALQSIREFYARYTLTWEQTSAEIRPHLFASPDGGRIPLEKYLMATLRARESLTAAGHPTLSGRGVDEQLATLAREHELSLKYLQQLWTALISPTEEFPFQLVQQTWRTAKSDDLHPLLDVISAWQSALWRFTNVGHIGRAGGPTRWQEATNPLASNHAIRLPLASTDPSQDVTMYLSTRAIDRAESAKAINSPANKLVDRYHTWRNPRLVAPGRPDLPLRDLRPFMTTMRARRSEIFSTTAQTLQAIAHELHPAVPSGSLRRLNADEIASQHQLNAEAVQTWMDYLGIGSPENEPLSYLTNRLTQAGGYDFVQGWGTDATPLVVANASDNPVRIPGEVAGRGVCVHPSPTQHVAVGWRAPHADTVRIAGHVQRAHPECGDGVAWSLVLRRNGTREILAQGLAEGRTPILLDIAQTHSVQPGDLISLIIDARQGNHSCDLTAVELRIISQQDAQRTWSLSDDVVPQILAGNPHPDRRGQADVWSFYTETVGSPATQSLIPAGSYLAQWQAAETPARKQPLGAALQELLLHGPADALPSDDPNRRLHQQLTALGGPLLVRAWQTAQQDKSSVASQMPDNEYGVDDRLFGVGDDPLSLPVLVPNQTLKVVIPAELASGAEFVTTAEVATHDGAGHSVQATVSLSEPHPDAIVANQPILVSESSPARHTLENGFELFRRLFPAALCYSRIVPVDEAVTLTLFHREDEHLTRLMLDSQQSLELERLWEEFHFTSHDALKLVNAYEQITEFATQDRPDMVIALAPMRATIEERAAGFRQTLVAAEPSQLNALLEFAPRVFRRPLTEHERNNLGSLYAELREQKLSHDEAFRFTLARLFVSPAFLYREEVAGEGTGTQPITDWEMASRLSYFLWSSSPDEELRGAASRENLKQPADIQQQAQRMLADPRVRRLAMEFACQWLHIYEFDALDEKSERHFPEFAAIRSDMYEEAILFFTDLFQNDRSLLSILDADHSFLNERLARFYGIEGFAGSGWQQVSGLRSAGRGGILGFAATLAKQSGASRTSPILRGNWLSEVVLGEKLPRPPKNVPVLPEDETDTAGLTMRELVTRHSSDPKCSGCHQKIDPFGFALESFDAIGRLRTVDIAQRSIDVKTRLPDGTEIDGLAGLRNYLTTTRRDAVVHQFCRKLLGFALGRSIQLSDTPLLQEMEQKLRDNDYRVGVAVDAIVTSRPFREIRSKQYPLTIPD